VTWGEIQLILSKTWSERGGRPDLDFLNVWINSAYADLLNYREWTGLAAQGTIQTKALYQTGTVNVTHGSAAVTGVGTSWSSAFNGYRFRTAPRSESYTFTVVNATSGTLDRPYEGETATELGYRLYQNIYPKPSGAKYIRQILNPLGRQLARWDRAQIDLTDGARLVTSPEPSAWAMLDLNFVEVWPVPEQSIGLTVFYEQEPQMFTGLNTEDSPVAWIPGELVLMKAKAKLLRFLGDYPGAAAEELAADRMLSSVSAVETQREAPVALRMASRFTRHRLQRWQG